MLLLFKPAVTLPAASLGIVLGLSGAGSGVTATLTTNIGLTAPTSIELRVNVTPDIHLGLVGIPVGFKSGVANIPLQIGINSKGGFGEVATPAILMGLSGTVGSFFDGGNVTLGTALGLSGNAAPSVNATPTIKLGITGTPTVSDGTVTPTATTGIVLGVTGSGFFANQAIADITFDLNGTGATQAPPTVTIASMALTFEADSMRMFFRKK